MSDSRALVKHLEAINAKSEAWVAEDPENRFAGSLVTVPDHWADYDVYTPEEFDRYLLEQDYIEGHKDVYGVKYRGDLSDVSDDDLSDMVTKMYEYAEAEMEDQREYMDELEALAELEWSDRITDEMREADELALGTTKWDDIAEDFDDVTKVKQIFH